MAKRAVRSIGIWSAAYAEAGRCGCRDTDPAVLIELQRSAIGTLVERSSRFTMLVHLPREDVYGVIPRTHTAYGVAPVVDLGPRQGTVGTRPVLDRLRCQGVLR